MTRLILGSRTYAPLSDVADLFITFDAVDPHSFTFGVSDVAMVAEKFGARRKPLESTRSTLLKMAKEEPIDGGDMDVVLFVARDPKTKQPTTGMAQIQTLLESEGIPFRVVSSPFPGSICEMVTELRHAVDKTVKHPHGARRDAMMARALGWSQVVTNEMVKYHDRLEESKNYEVGNEELDSKYIRWVRIYEELNDALTDATRMLT